MKNKTKCIEWNGRKNNKGYGRFYFEGYDWRIHRLIYKLYVGDLIKGLVIDHICRNRACINPQHLRQVTLRENTLENSNSVSAINSKKKRCIYNHLLSGANLTIKKNKSRRCKICHRNSANKPRHKKA